MFSTSKQDILAITLLQEEALWIILTEIDVQATLKKKPGVEFSPYKILSACNPAFAYQALQAEPRIGTMLPCNVILRELADGRVEISTVDPSHRCRRSTTPL